MENRHRNILRHKRLILSHNIDNQTATELLYKAQILTTSDKELLNSIPTNIKKNEKLLDILPRRGPKAFDAFHDMLKQCNLSHVLGDCCLEKEEKEKEEQYFDCVPMPPPTNGHSSKKNAPKEEKESTNGGRNGASCNMFEGRVSVTTESNLDVADVTGRTNNTNMPKEDFDDNAFDVVDTPPQKPKMSVYFESGFATDRIDGAPTNGSGPNSASPTGAEGEDGPSLLGFRKTVAPDKPDSIHVPLGIDDSNSYPMNKQPRGYFLLINNKEFLEESTMQPYPRHGTDLDAQAMEALFQELGYIVHAYKNQTCNQIRSAIKNMLRMDLTRVSCVACCFLSHGKEGVLYGTDGEIEIRDITSYFREKRDLVGKPKMFFFQACQGSDYMDGMQPMSDMEVDGPGDSSRSNDISLPSEADFLYAYSTVPGYYSWRNSQNGSWFIQGLVRVFREHAHKMDVLRMLTRVNQIVSSRKSATGQHLSHDKRQICSIITQLRYELFLKPPHGPLKT